MAETKAALLEFGDRPVVWTFTELASTSQVFKTLYLLHHFQHVLGIILPVGGHVQDAVLLQLAMKCFHKTGLDQASLVMSLLVPGVGEKNIDRLQAIIWYCLLYTSPSPRDA